MYGSFVSAKVFGLMYSYGWIHVSLRCWFSCSLTLAISNQFSEVQIALVARNNLILELAQRILKADERSVWIRTRPETREPDGGSQNRHLPFFTHPPFIYARTGQFSKRGEWEWRVDPMSGPEARRGPGTSSILYVPSKKAAFWASTRNTFSGNYSKDFPCLILELATRCYKYNAYGRSAKCKPNWTLAWAPVARPLRAGTMMDRTRHESSPEGEVGRWKECKVIRVCYRRDGYKSSTHATIAMHDCFNNGS